MYTLYCITDLYSFVRANGLTSKLIRIHIRIRIRVVTLLITSVITRMNIKAILDNSNIQIAKEYSSYIFHHIGGGQQMKSCGSVS